jgi:hypothetical protein
MKKYVALAGLLAIATTAHGGSTSSTIQSILIVEDSDMVYVYPTSGVQNPPACHGGNGNYYSFKLSRPRAREYLAALLAAQASGASVNFYGKGACVDQSVSETLGYLAVVSP